MCQPKPESPWQQVTEREVPVLKCLLVKTVIPRHFTSEHTLQTERDFTPAGLETAFNTVEWDTSRSQVSRFEKFIFVLGSRGSSVTAAIRSHLQRNRRTCEPSLLLSITLKYRSEPDSSWTRSLLQQITLGSMQISESSWNGKHLQVELRKNPSPDMKHKCCCLNYQSAGRAGRSNTVRSADFQ